MTTTTASTTSEPDQKVWKHPIRGATWGLLLGLGAAIYLVIFAVVPFGDWAILGLVVLLGIGLGVVWAHLAPAKKPKGEAPATSATATTAATGSSVTDVTPTGTESPDDWVTADAGDDLLPPPPPGPDPGTGTDSTSS
jgi:hypothetical protein